MLPESHTWVTVTHSSRIQNCSLWPFLLINWLKHHLEFELPLQSLSPGSTAGSTRAQHQARSCEAACPPPSCLTLPLAESCTAGQSLALTQSPGVALGKCSQSSEFTLPNSGLLLTIWAVRFTSGWHLLPPVTFLAFWTQGALSPQQPRADAEIRVAVCLFVFPGGEH